ncbi:hypothetical protein M433DRAFT_358235 [Acidomyces richmondensis BFW]|nr:MAG: hypothetical protein FE78DRAFT_494041 [Acidomyces sp. 'richmondensis']KYG43402.1 hypothetical protein M433DRAFT_358235 [Acidomyces richmondensis BFW]
MAEQTRIFRVRLNCVDHYQSPPSSLDPPIWGSTSITSTQQSRLPHIPIIRVFGATETGQKVCAHIHGAFPYLYIPYEEDLSKEEREHYIATLRHSIDHALTLSYRRNPYDSNPRNTTYVAHISLVKGVPFFGYHVGYQYFLKIYLLNPQHMTRFADLLQQGAIMKRTFQPYEAHLQYLLQWMCDFNLYGCAYIETDRPNFRTPVPAWDQLKESTHLWHDRSIPPDMLMDESMFPRQSQCQLELDIRVEDILNRRDVRPRPLHHSFIERLSCPGISAPEEKLVHSMAGLWKDETRRRKLRMGISDPSSSPFPPEVLVSMSADPRNDSKGGWVHEDEFRQMVAALVEQERKARGFPDVSFELFEKKLHTDEGIQTVLESIEELFCGRLATKMGSHTDYVCAKDKIDRNKQEEDGLPEKYGDAVVDMSSFAYSPSEDEYMSDEEEARVKAMTQTQTLHRTEISGNDIQIDNVVEHADKMTALHSLEHVESGQGWKRAAIASSQYPSKRPKATGNAETSPSKYVKFLGDDVLHKRASNAPLLDNDNLKHPTTDEQDSKNIMREVIDQSTTTSYIQPPQSSPTSSQGNKISFPVIKDPHSSQKRVSFSSHMLKDGHASISKTSSSTPEGQQKEIIYPDIIHGYQLAFAVPPKADVFIFNFAPPSCQEVESTLSPQVIYQDAYYSNEKDVPERPREYAGQEFRLESNTIPYLQPFDKGGAIGPFNASVDKAKAEIEYQRKSRLCTLREWEIMEPPPTFAEVQAWVDNEWLPAQGGRASDVEEDGPSSGSQIKRKVKLAPEMSQLDAPTQKNKYGFKYSQHKASTSVQHETGYMSIMSLEVHVNSRGDLAPDPEKDEINMIAWCITDEQMEEDAVSGIVLLDAEDNLTAQVQKILGNNVRVEAEDNELDLINRMVSIVRTFDPDILTGFEVHNSSWGYLIERARLQYEFNLPDEFSRMKAQSHGRFGKDADRWGFTHTSTVRITGRHTINIWRAMRSELNLLQYTMENVCFHLLHRRIPYYSFATLTQFWQSGKPRDLTKVLDYFLTRTTLDLEILDANELIPRTSEQARLLGVDFFSVFSRGSQFKVESLMFRIAKPESFVLVSPSRKQVGAQNALECLPLVMEPQSAFYTSPLLVLDFQSLYPSVMIAYNYCYSTCLGRIVNWRGANKLGFTDFHRAPGLLELAKDHINIAPNGMMYVKPSLRKSLLAKMLGEILETRVMVKSGMKVDKDDRTLQQLLNNRQLALKLIANVTYGYTSASFSGRMPCSEIADSIVQTGRETLEKAIAFIHSVERWGAEVVYGDTDSLFVYLKGRSRAEAFKIGEEISRAVTDMNPRPVKLKFEKVYHPCVLLAKKRYVGFKYESVDQAEPEFDAKGIETVRRDGTPAEQKIEEKALKLLFRTSDLSQIKSYVQAQCTKIMSGHFSVQDFCFAKEVKLGTYAEKGPPPPGALIATRRMMRDPRMEPQYGERVPYVVIAGSPGARLWERCVEPERLIYDENAELDAEYYINKNIIPPLERIFNLVGANVRQWYDEMPKVQRIRVLGGQREGNSHGFKSNKTMESYMGSSLCLVCRIKLPLPPPHVEESDIPLCNVCREDKVQHALLALRTKLQKAERKARYMNDVCRDCANLAPIDEVKCESRDCPVFYSRVKADTHLGAVRNGVGRVLEALQNEVGRRSTLEW